MLMALEMLPEWTTFAAQRIGTEGGPMAPEYELTENELDWFVWLPSSPRQAILTCFPLHS
jgi:hypothetical protein